MSGKSTYSQNLYMGWLRGTGMPSPPAALYVALFSADPTDAGSLTNEVTTTIRPGGRLAVTFGAPSASAGASTMSNTAAVDFGAAAGSANVTWFGLFDAPSGGNMLGSGTVTGGNFSTGTQVLFPVGQLTYVES